MSRPNRRIAYLQDVNEVSSTKKDRLGILRVTDDGRKFRYAKLAATIAGQPGYLYLMPAMVANHNNLTATAIAVGAVNGSVTVGATAVTEDQYADGFLVIREVSGGGAAGPGQIYRIKSNTACDAAGTTYFALEDPVRFAIAATHIVDLVPNPWNGVSTSATAGAPAGFAQVSATSAYYLWLQTGGEGLMYAGSAILINQPVRQASASAGGVQMVNNPDGTLSMFNSVPYTSFAIVGYNYGRAASGSTYFAGLIRID